MAARGESLAPALASYIVESACAGLHAAHELVGPDGTPLEVVHRDVSPWNLFVSYDGAVKVMDFGVARAAERIHQTRTRQVKGHYAYMAPLLIASTSSTATAPSSSGSGVGGFGGGSVGGGAGGGGCGSW